MKTTFLTFLLSTALIMSLNYPAYPATSQDDYSLLLKFGQVNVPENASAYLAAFNPARQDVYEGYFHKIVQFYTIPQNSVKRELEGLGLQFINYIPNKAYTIAFPYDFDLNLLSNYNIRNISDIVPEFKMDPYLLDKNYPAYAMRSENTIEVMVSFYSSVSYDHAKADISSYIIKMVQDDAFSHTSIFQISVDDIDEIASLPFVSFVEPIYPPSEPENYTGKTLHRSNVLDSQYPSGRHYDGTGVHVMLQDDGIIGPHADYEGRIGDQFLTSNSGNHGDHCAGIIFGAGNIDPKTTGQAPGAELYVYGAAPIYPGFNSIPSHYGTYDIRITSTSYSNGCNAGYTSLARTMDLQIRSYESLMHVFSAGNDGGSDCGYGAGAGWGNVTGGHKIAKNVIAVANLNYYGSLSGSSSRGPAHDGRIKPDISAKGSDVYSTINPNDYGFKSGTSMSCPGVSGSLAQLYQAYKDLNGGQEPKGGLMKALVMNTADDLGNTGPDFKFGWGEINNFKAVVALEENRYLTDEISEGETQTHNIPVPANVKELKVMVYWTDKEATVATNKALVNDLDIVVTGLSNDDHLPWILSSYPHPDSLNKPATKGVDHLNNVEQVSILDPAAGNYTLTVDGFEIPYGPQEYYVVYEFIKDEIEVTYPIGGETFPPSETATVRWDTFGDDGDFTIEYSTDNGQNWNEVTSSVNGGLRYYNWNVPNEMTGEAKIRVSRNGLSGETPDKFSIMSAPDDLEFVRACVSSVLIKWEQVASAVSYDVYQLGDKYMEIIGSSTSDSLWVEGINYDEEYWFAVRAVGPGNAYSRRTIAKMKEPGVWNCLFSKDISLEQILSPPTGVVFDCQDYSSIVPKISIKNTGQDPMQNITANFQFENGTVVTENVSGSIEPGETIMHEFSTSVSITTIGIYDVKAWVEAPDDENISNDEIEGVCKVKNTQYFSTNENFNFDEFSACEFSPDCGLVNCYINNAWFNFQNDLNDDIDWRLMNGITPTGQTGPLGDHTTGTIEGKFLYLEPSGECYNKEAILTTPCVNLNSLTNPALAFWFNLNGSDMGTLHVDVVSEGTLHPDVMDPLTGNWGQNWVLKYVSLNQFAGKEVNIRFRGYTGNGELGDMAIDDIMFAEMTSIDEVFSNNGLQVYPNPSEGLYRISSNRDFSGVISIKVHDITGRIVHNEELPVSEKGELNYALDLSHLGSGVYYLVLDNGKEVLKEKLLKY